MMTLKLRNGQRLHPNSVEVILKQLPEIEDAAVILTEPFQSLGWL